MKRAALTGSKHGYCTICPISCLVLRITLEIFKQEDDIEKSMFTGEIGTIKKDAFKKSPDVMVCSCQISYVFIVGRYVRVWGLKRPQKTSNVSIF